MNEHNRTGLGRFANYNALPDILVNNIFPNYFQIILDTSSMERMKNQAEKYSKGRVNKPNDKWNETESIHKKIDIDQKNAIDLFLKEQYLILNKLADSTNWQTRIVPVAY